MLLVVHAGLAQVMASPAVAEQQIEYVEEHPSRPGTGIVLLAEVAWFDDDALIRAAPRAAWQAFAGTSTEQPGMFLAHHPDHGLVEGAHVDDVVSVPLHWTDPGAMVGQETRHLDRLRTITAALNALGDPTAATPANPEDVVGRSATATVTRGQHNAGDPGDAVQALTAGRPGDTEPQQDFGLVEPPTATADDVLRRVDWWRLAAQKETLVRARDAATDPTAKEDLEGLLHLIDGIQDYAVTHLDAPDVLLGDTPWDEDPLADAATTAGDHPRTGRQR